MKEFKEKLIKFQAERYWNKFHTPENLKILIKNNFIFHLQY